MNIALRLSLAKANIAFTEKQVKRVRLEYLFWKYQKPVTQVLLAVITVVIFYLVVATALDIPQPVWVDGEHCVLQ